MYDITSDKIRKTKICIKFYFILFLKNAYMFKDFNKYSGCKWEEQKLMKIFKLKNNKI